MTASRRRSTYLPDGRRVRLVDLLEAGLLNAGDNLEFVRPRIGQRHEATVTYDGKIQISDGRSFVSPSRAASRAVGGGSFDGWLAWRLTADGTYLSFLRRQLLDQTLADTRITDQTDTDTGVAQRHEFLREARIRAAAGDPMTISVREMIRHWGLISREPAGTDRIQADLENYGLYTDPNFAKVGLDTLVRLVTQTVGREEAAEPINSGEDDGSEETAVVEVGVTLGNLPSATGGVEAITPQASFDEAITKMLLNDFSQLPVITGQRDVKGAVTWQSIARAQHAEPDAALGSAIIDASVFAYDKELIDVLATLQDEDFVLVKDQTNAVTGIVTTADVVRAYGQLATPFFLIGELDQLLRRIIRENFSIETVQQLCDPNDERELTNYDNLTMGDYERVLENPKQWTELGWTLSRQTFVARLRELREARNDIMHFNPDPIAEEIVLKIRHMIHVLKRYGI